MISKIKICFFCEFYKESNSCNSIGTCRYYAPTLEEETMWPEVSAYDFCGEFNPDMDKISMLASEISSDDEFDVREVENSIRVEPWGN